MVDLYVAESAISTICLRPCHPAFVSYTLRENIDLPEHASTRVLQNALWVTRLYSSSTSPADLASASKPNILLGNPLRDSHRIHSSSVGRFGQSPPSVCPWFNGREIPVVLYLVPVVGLLYANLLLGKILKTFSRSEAEGVEED
ncbi:hypothetical protein D9756_010977 [Leucocoprinus leucothites]|uniref:Uncharacterized protein n=1 Tax=Leucocoprinus leucothites TaxID=201217 RepID=A0A8H5FQ23_9AGAR|nr:hypothetical protein D9756_010977 [Leucoagaricus leucothites]